MSPTKAKAQFWIGAVTGCTLALAGVARGETSDLDGLLPSRLASIEVVRIPLAPGVAPGEWVRTAEAESLALSPWRSPLLDAPEREARVQAHRPIPPPEAAAPERPGAVRDAAFESARLFEAAGDAGSARLAWERGLALGSDDIGAWRGLGRMRLRSGDGPAAESAFLHALQLAERVGDPMAMVELRAQIHRDLAKIYLLDGRTRDARIALESSEGLVEADSGVLAWIQRSLVPVTLAPPPRPGAPAPEWPEAPPEAWLAPVERIANQVEGALPTEARGLVDRSRAWLSVEGRRRGALMAGAALLVFLVLLRLIRQRGDMTVTIEYPEELRGVFRVRVANSRANWRSGPRGARGEVLKGGVSTRFEHHLVNRETHFQRLLTRRYDVTVEGVLLDPRTEEILDDFFEHKIVRVRHRRTVRLEFDAKPETCPVDVEVVWDDRRAEDVGVVARDVPESLQRVAGGAVRLGLEKGTHRLVVGCGDRVMERDVVVGTYQPTRVTFDLAGGEVVFKGCPPAVEPYLRGDIEAVAKALERDGQATQAYLMLAQLHRDQHELERAADYFESAGELREAAELRADLLDYTRAATLYAEAGDPVRAAEMHREAGDLVRAGDYYELARNYDLAIESYREAGAVSKWINALERRGEVFQAAGVALVHDQRPRAIRLLQVIAPEDTDYAEACRLLTDAFEREGHFDLAAQKMGEHIATFPRGTAPADKHARLADLHEAAGQIERALDVLEDLRRREPTYPNVASRIETLRKQRSAADRLTAPSGSVSAGDAPTAFVAEYRYEILEEVGRGGMGVVFKARDRRLDRIVALKRLPEDLRRHHPRAVQLFLREAQSAARLNHPNIVTVFDTDQEDGTFFITMELLSGEPFQRILRERGRLTTSSAVSVGMQVAAGLQYAHEQGVVHRDIKTANLFLTSDKVVKIMDFGLAKMFEEVRSGTTVISGTPFYMSPEQIVGAAVDQRTDLYSLGVTLFELLTGQVPFAQGDIAYHHRHTPIPDVRELVPDLPDALAELLESLLEKDVEARCPSAEALQHQLEAIKKSLRDSG